MDNGNENRLKFQPGKQRELMLLAQDKLNKNRKELSELIGTNRITMKNWVNERNLLPESMFNSLKHQCPELKKYEKFIVERLDKNWGSVKGGTNAYLKMISGDRSRVYGIMERLRSKIKLKRKVEAELPSCEYTSRIVESDVDALPLLVSLLMTDGNIYKNQITYGTIDSVLRNVFIDLCKLNGVENVFEYERDGFRKIYCGDKGLLERLRNLSPSYKKSPNRTQGKDDFLKEAQPSIEHFFRLERKTLAECLRLAMSSDGNISIKTRRNGRRIELKPQLALNCAHPGLCKEWSKIFEIFGISMNLCRSKETWSGIRGLITDSRKNMMKFYELGGFVDGVKISRKSRRLAGVEKNEALKFILYTKQVGNRTLNDLLKLGS